jgi:uncharacterized protein (DUF433 family)
VVSLFEHLQAGDAIETFLNDFPGVTREQAVAVLEMSASQLISELEPR